MKGHPSQLWPAFSGMSDTDDPERIPEDELQLLVNATCDPTGQIKKWPGTYPVTMADALGIISTDPRTKVYSLARFRGKNSDARAVAIVGDTMLRSGANNIYGTWVPITFPTDYTTPLLARPADFVFRNRYCYHQNGFDLPFRVKMEEDDGSSPASLAEILGLPAPLHPFKMGTFTNGFRYPQSTTTEWVVTFVYGDRGESGPSPPGYLQCTSTDNFAYFNVTDLPLGPTGCTARRIYRTMIGAGKGSTAGASAVNAAYLPLRREFFFCAEIPDNTTTTVTGSDLSFPSIEDSNLDFSRRVPPPRPLPPIARYQKIHQDRLIWANLRDHPWIMELRGDPSRAAVTSASVTVSNTGNGTLTITTNLATTTVTDYKTKSLETIWKAISAPDFSSIGDFTSSGAGVLARIASGVDWNRTYRFRAVTAQDIYGTARYFLEAIDDEADAVVVDGSERFPNRVMFSNLSYPEEINPLNFVDVSRHDVYPITGLFRDDYTLGLCTENDIWLLTGSFSVNPETFAPDFSLARSQSEHGSICTRPDAIAQTPKGIIFVAKDGLRLFRGQNSSRFARQIRRRLMERIIAEPRARDNVALHYESGLLYIAYPGVEVA